MLKIRTFGSVTLNVLGSSSRGRISYDGSNSYLDLQICTLTLNIKVPVQLNINMSNSPSLSHSLTSHL